LEGIVSEKTMATHIVNEILVPEKRVSGGAGKGQGSKLSFSDLVQEAILSTLFRQGLRVEHVTIRGKQFPTARLWIGDQAGEWGTRQPQECLEENDYKVLVYMTMMRALEPPNSSDQLYVGTGLPASTHHIADVCYVPVKDAKMKEKAFDHTTAALPWESHLFVYAGHWREVIASRLE
jgi:hypothetical protein